MEGDRHHLKPKRTGHSHVEDAPPPRHSHEHKRAAMVVGVGATMLVIVALYAASFRYRDVAGDLSSVPRWSVIKDEVMQEADPFARSFREMSAAIDAAFRAHGARAESIEILKAKIMSASNTEETGSATSTPATSTPVTP